MRPVYLKMSAFGPFAGVAEVDFTRLGTEGIYLLAGETGAGKTTVFDAITFALFGQCSGEARKPEDLRSDYAGPETQTYVDLTFELRGKRYRIKRDPGGYPRTKKRGEGTTVCAAESTMEMPDGSQVSGKRVSEKVTELLGIDANQFGQIVMLAQGDFEKLLTEGTKERTVIFRKIFGTDMYQRFQDALNEQRGKLKDQCAQGAHEAEVLARQALACMDETDGPRTRLADWLERNALQSTNALSALQQELEILEGRQGIEAGKLEAAQVDYEALARDLDRALQAEKTRKQAEEARSRLERIDGRMPELEAQAQACTQANEAVPALQERAGALRDQLPTYAKHTEALRQVEEATQAKTSAEQAFATCEEACRQASRQVDVLNAQASALAGAREALVRAQAGEAEAKHGLEAARTLRDAAAMVRRCDGEMADADARLKKAEVFLASLDKDDAADEAALNSQIAQEMSLSGAQKALSQAQLDLQASNLELAHVRELMGQLDQLEADLAHKQAKHRTAAQAYQQAGAEQATCAHDVEILRRAYEDGLAGILAAGLAPGSPCPVCGATDHPHLAHQSESTPSKEDIQTAQAREEQARAHATKLCGEANAAFELAQNAQKALEEFTGSNGSRDSLTSRAAQIENKISDTEGIVARLKADCAALETARAEQQRLRDQMTRRSRTRQDANERAASIKEARTISKTTQQSALDALCAASTSPDDAQALFDAAQTALDQAVRARETHEADAQKLLQTEELLKRSADEADAAAEQREQARQALEQARQTEQVAKERERLMGERLEFADEAAAQSELAKLDERVHSLKNDLENARKAVQDARAERTGIASTLETLHGRLNELGTQDVQQARDNLTRSEAGLAEAKNRERACSQALNTVKGLAESMASLESKDAKLQEAYARIDRLASVAGGAMAGKERLTFETFVQMRYFEVVLAAANTRLSEMTQGQYELVRCERSEGGAAKVGLNVDVLDNFTGKARSAKSLSGGEKFMASLALALGLSEVVQRQAGGIQLDTMFVDEGFGSLDQEKLRLVMRAMARPGATGKLVGIISHVEELMSTIDRKIVVERGRNGSTLHVEV